MITFRCDECSRALRVDDSLSGRKARCPTCRQETVIPAPSLDTRRAEAAKLPGESATLPPAPLDSATTLAPLDPAATLALSGTTPGPRDARAPAGYEIEKELGRGGMGVVYKARSLALQRPCALKMLLSGAHSGSDEIERFRTEAQAIARLQHPGIVQVFEIGEHDGRPFMALEFCSGGSLDSKLAKNPLKPKDAAKLVRSLAEAMQAAHEANVIHRDLKPANVLLTDKGKPKVTDFGLAKKLDEGGATRTGSVMGTPSYMPPEQAEGRKDIGPAADVYALGAILYECLASRPPFRAATALDTILQVLTDEPVAVRQLNSKAPVDLETIALKCLQKNPKNRYATAQELADDLGRYLGGEPIRARPVGAVERGVKWVRRNGVVSALATAVLLALTAGVAVSGWFAVAAGEEAKAARKAEGKAEGEAKLARKAEAEAKQREKAEAVAKALAQKETERAEAEKVRANEQLRRAEWSVYAGKLLLAQAAFNENNVPEAFRHLEECQWNLRGWEHAHLRWRFDSSKQTLLGHASDVNSVAFSPDGKRILTGSDDKTAKVWDAERGTVVLVLEGHTKSVRRVAFSPDGTRILTGSQDSTAKVWDAEKGTEVLALKGHTRDVTSVAFSPDGTRIFTGSDDKTAKVWDAERGTEVLALKGLTDSVTSVAFSPDGKRILTGIWGSTAKVWDAQKGTEILTLRDSDTVTSVAFSPDGKRILTGSGDSTAKVWDAEKGTVVLALRGHSNSVSSVAFSPDGKRILTGSGDSMAKVWDAQKGTEILSLKGHTQRVSSVAFSPNGTRILTGSGDRTAKVWDAERGTEVLALEGHTNSVRSVAFSPDSKRILTGSHDTRAKVWDAERGTEILALEGHTGMVSSAAFSPDGKRILTGSHDSTAKVWDAQKGTKILALEGHTHFVTSVAFSPDGKRILTGSTDRKVKVWDAERGTEILALEGHTDNVTSVAFSPDGKRILTGSWDKTAKVWDAQKGTLVFTFADASGPMAFSPDGKRILIGSQIGSQDSTAKVREAQKGTVVLALKGHASGVISVAFSPDGKRILTGSWDKTAKVWDAQKGTEILALKGHTHFVTSVAFSPDGKRILTGSDDKTAKVWDAEKGTVVLALKGHANEVLSAAFSGDGKRVFAWDVQSKVLAWSAIDGKPVEPRDMHDLPQMTSGGYARSPDGRLAAKPNGYDNTVIDLLRGSASDGDPWPLPDADQRKRYHTEQAALAEKQKQHFAVAFHLGRLLLDSPDDAGLKMRRDQALKAHAGE